MVHQHTHGFFILSLSENYICISDLGNIYCASCSAFHKSKKKTWLTTLKLERRNVPSVLIAQLARGNTVSSKQARIEKEKWPDVDFRFEEINFRKSIPRWRITCHNKNFTKTPGNKELPIRFSKLKHCIINQSLSLLRIILCIVWLAL